MPEYQITTKKVEPQTVASIRAVIPNYSAVGELFGEIFGYTGSRGAKLVGPTFFICHDLEFKEKDVDMEVGFPIDQAIPGAGRLKVYELPGMEEAACTVYKGRYEDIGEAYNAIVSWAESNGYQINGPSRELYLVSPADTTDPSQYVTEVQFPVAKA
ncbi:GyrI-like domain-containing protein [Chloroflexota bacterium]